jgi:hypothetical protein
MRHHDRRRMLLPGLPYVVLTNEGVRRAVSGPQDQLAPGLLLDEPAQMLVGHEDNLLVERQ